MAIDLDSLSAAEKQELYAQLAFSMQDQDDASDLPRELWDAMLHVLQLEGKSRMTLKAFVRGYGRAKYIQRGEELDKLLAAALPAYTRKQTVVAVRRIILGCLVQRMNQKGIPVSPTSILRCFPWMRAAVDAAYPGYIDAQLLHKVVLAFA